MVWRKRNGEKKIDWEEVAKDLRADIPPRDRRHVRVSSSRPNSNSWFTFSYFKNLLTCMS